MSLWKAYFKTSCSTRRHGPFQSGALCCCRRVISTDEGGNPCTLLQVAFLWAIKRGISCALGGGICLTLCPCSFACAPGSGAVICLSVNNYPHLTWTAMFPGTWDIRAKTRPVPGSAWPPCSILCIEPSRSRWASHSSPESSQCLPCCLLYTQGLWCGEGLWYERVTGMKEAGLGLQNPAASNQEWRCLGIRKTSSYWLVPGH